MQQCHSYCNGPNPITHRSTCCTILKTMSWHIDCKAMISQGSRWQCSCHHHSAHSQSFLFLALAQGGHAPDCCCLHSIAGICPVLCKDSSTASDCCCPHSIAGICPVLCKDSSTAKAELGTGTWAYQGQETGAARPLPSAYHHCKAQTPALVVSSWWDAPSIAP